MRNSGPNGTIRKRASLSSMVARKPRPRTWLNRVTVYGLIAFYIDPQSGGTMVAA
jgi:hypothetical protein